jgi:hypothetical protein
MTADDESGAPMMQMKASRPAKASGVSKKSYFWNQRLL